MSASVFAAVLLALPASSIRRWAVRIGGLLGTVLALLIGGGGLTPARAQSGPGEQGPALRDPYALQINASPEADRVAAQLDSLRRRGMPAYRTQVTRSDTIYHRLRLGPFPSRAAAQAFARCRSDSTDAWLVPARAAERAAFERVVRAVQTDVVSLRPQAPRFLLGRENAFVALLMPAEGRAATAGQPVTLRVYAPGRDAPAVIERVTGVREAEGGLEYGRAARVFVKDTSETVADHGEAVETFSRARGLSRYVVEDQLALYDGGRVARFTLLGRLALPGGTPQTLDQPGFDYVGTGGQAVRYRGAVEEDRAQKLGNADDHSLRRAAPTQAATARAALLARPTAREQNARVCTLFFLNE